MKGSIRIISCASCQPKLHLWSFARWVFELASLLDFNVLFPFKGAESAVAACAIMKMERSSTERLACF